MAGLQSTIQTKRTSGRLRFFVGGAIIALVIAWLILSNIGHSTTPYLTVGEVIAEGPSGRLVRAVGIAREIDWDPQAMVLHFEIEDESGSLPVAYKGTRPDLLTDGARTVVEGKYNTDGIILAAKVLLKCPSKYEEQ